MNKIKLRILYNCICFGDIFKTNSKYVYFDMYSKEIVFESDSSIRFYTQNHNKLAMKNYFTRYEYITIDRLLTRL